MSDTTTPADTETGTDTPAALPGDGLRDGVIDRLRSDIGDGLVDTHLMPQTDLWLRVSAESWLAAGASLKAQGFEYFCFLSAIDWLPSPYGKGEDDPTVEKAPLSTEVKQGYAGGDTRFQVFARLTDIDRHFGVTIKVDVPDSLSMATWIPLFAGANWHERETHEMFGITFDGHPDMRNLYLPGEFEGFPLRKDFPLLSRMVKPWPGIVDVEPMPAVESADDEESVAAVEAAPADSTPADEVVVDEEAAEAPADDAAPVEDAAPSEVAAPAEDATPDAPVHAAPVDETADAPPAGDAVADAVPADDDADGATS